jgi:hypothetical protein
MCYRLSLQRTVERQTTNHRQRTQTNTYMHKAQRFRGRWHTVNRLRIHLHTRGEGGAEGANATML